jgi:hypothetical protein
VLLLSCLLLPFALLFLFFRLIFHQHTQTNPAILTTLDGRFHQLDDDDLVTFREVKGMEELNGKVFSIKGTRNEEAVSLIFL